jgi:hypothetical protein
MFNVEKFGDQIYYFTNIIDNPQNFVDTLEYLESVSDDTKVFMPRIEWNASMGKELRYGDVQRIKFDRLNTLPEEELKKSKFIIDTVHSAMEQAFNYVKDDQNIKDNVNIYPDFCIHRYYEGAAMGAHYDQQEGNFTLKYSIVIYLNDDYEGGEISFVIKNAPLDMEDKPREDLNDSANKDRIDFYVKPKAGSALVFPAFEPYHHTAHLVKSGKKYMIPGHWVKGENDE